MATEHILTRGSDTIRIVHDGCDLVTGEGEHSVTQTFDDDAEARSHLDYVLGRLRRNGYGVTSRRLVQEQAQRDVHDGLFEWDGEHHRLRCVFTDDAGVRTRCEVLPDVAAARAAVGLHVVCDPASPGNALAVALAERPLAKVRRFVFDAPFQTVTRQRDNSPGRLDLLLQGLPALESAYVTGAVELRGCRHPRLKHLHLLGDPLPAGALAGLGDSDLPALERLVLCLSRDDEPASTSDVVRALRRLRAPALRQVYLSGSDDLVALLDELCAAPLHPWTVLSVEGVLRDEDDLLDVLQARADVLGRLGRLALPLVDDLSDDAAERVVELLPRVIDRDELPDQLLPSVYEEW
ncbi:hypothetical protein SAMN02745121_02124 [Nannocystis exedens]|uniref:Uncharacterized protein n=1 Tax=Nannocystis exedens TaxID=54 RepID=A0A1I1WBN1_9BACT|nr:hypothetical protein [Nannocystis exedens]PCC67488.1 hypothetical protein NAEX_00495 [Nannocystis exedens]SFD90813.1 hypothetical protein SAMN02745121_02124 [Nannocystis exedens]